MNRKEGCPGHLVQSSRFRRSRTAARMVALLLGYMFCRTSSSSPSRQASGSRTVTSFMLLTPHNINALLLILHMTLKLKAMQISFRIFFLNKAIIQDYVNRRYRNPWGRATSCQLTTTTPRSIDRSAAGGHKAVVYWVT